MRHHKLRRHKPLGTFTHHQGPSILQTALSNGGRGLRLTRLLSLP